ncbi:MAG TPA: carbohydrate binding domain-containing protein, partial [Elusimicrobiota bacterium]|nr:carbohydrate binding domain-containing protein [Elusimicrobiota bacterium]
PAVEPPAPPPLAVPPPTPEVPAAAEPPIAETPSRAIEPEPEPAVRPEKREKSKPPRAEKKSEPEKKTEPEKKKKSAKPADLPRLASPYLLLSNNRPMKIDADTTAEIIAETIVVGGQPALEIRYRMEEGRWVRVSFNTPSDLHGARFVTLTFRGEGNTNAIEFGVVDADGTVASASWSKGTGTPTWSTAEVAVENLSRSGGDGELDWSHVRSMYVRVAKGRSGEGGNGTALVRSVKIF